MLCWKHICVNTAHLEWMRWEEAFIFEGLHKRSCIISRHLESKGRFHAPKEKGRFPGPFACMDSCGLLNVKLLRVQRRVRLDDDGFAHHLLVLVDPAPAAALQLFDDLRVHTQHDILTFEVLLHLA